MADKFSYLIRLANEAIPVGLAKWAARLPWPRARQLVPVLALVVAVLLIAPSNARRQGTSFPRAEFMTAAPASCIASDDPAALILMDRLSSDLRAGCDVAVDVTGASYGSAVPRSMNEAFHAWLLHYLTSSAAYVVVRPGSDALGTVDRRTLSQRPVLASGGGLHLHAGDATG